MQFWKLLVVVLGLGFSSPLLVQAAAQKPADSALEPTFETLIDDYLAVFHGVGADDRPVNDGDARYYERRLYQARKLLERLRAIDRGKLSFEQDIDYRYVDGILVTAIMEGEKVARWRQDPRIYLSIEPIVGEQGGLLSEERGSLTERADGLLETMRLIPVRLENAKRNLTVFMPLWLEPSLSWLDVIADTIAQDLPRFAERLPDRRGEIMTEVANVSKSLQAYRTFLENEWTRKPQGDWRVGKEAFDFRLRHLYHIDDIDAEDLYRWGRREYEEQLRVLEQAARHVDPRRSWRQIEEDLQADHPSAEARIYEYLKQVRRTRPWLLENDLATVPWDTDNTAIAIRMPAFYGRVTFTGYGGAPVGRGSTRPGSVKLSPLDPDSSPATQEQFLRTHNYAFIGTLMPHEVYPGHALVQLYLNHNPRKLRTYESAYSNQAWCYYVEWVLTPEHGFYPPDKHDEYMVEMERLKLWRYVRVIYDAGMHLGLVDVDEAVNLMTNDVMFAEPYSFMQVLGATSGYGDTGVPTWGYHEVLRLRDDYFDHMFALGKKGTLKDFHDRFLKIGTLPVKLLREELFHQIETESAGDTDTK